MKTVAHEGLTYAEIRGFRPLLLDLHVPAAAGPESPVPFVVWMHGGAFWEGDRRYLPSNLAPNAIFNALVAAGIAVATIDYRLSREAKFPAQLHDVRAAIRYLRSNAAKWGLDAGSVGVWGESAGGTLGALAALAPIDDAGNDHAIGSDHATAREDDRDRDDRPLAAAALWSSPTDLVALRHFSAIAGLLGSTGVEAEAEVKGAGAEAAVATAAQASPVTHVRRDAPPFLIMHAIDDPKVPVHQAKRLHEALLSAGARSTFVSVEDAGHVFEDYPAPQRLVERTVTFFAQELAAKNLDAATHELCDGLIHGVHVGDHRRDVGERQHRVAGRRTDLLGAG